MSKDQKGKYWWEISSVKSSTESSKPRLNPSVSLGKIRFSAERKRSSSWEEPSTRTISICKSSSKCGEWRKTISSRKAMTSKNEKAKWFSSWKSTTTSKQKKTFKTSSRSSSSSRTNKNSEPPKPKRSSSTSCKETKNRPWSTSCSFSRATGNKAKPKRTTWSSPLSQPTKRNNSAQYYSSRTRLMKCTTLKR